MDPGKIIILAAVEIEARAVRRALVSIDPQQYVLHTIGIRGVRLPTELAVDHTVAILMVGLAGALDPWLKVGDIVVDDPQAILPASLPLRRGTIHTTTRIAATPAEKAELFAQTHAAAVDMESDIVRQFAAERGLSFIGIRAISDTAEETLDPEVVRMVDDAGRPRAVTIAAALLRRPALIPHLARVGKNARLAATRLGGAVRLVVDALLGL